MEVTVTYSRANSAAPAPSRNLLEEYAQLLQTYLQGNDKTTLRRAYVLGRKAANDGDILSLAAIHQRAIVDFLLASDPQKSPEEAAQTMGTLCAACPSWYCNPDERTREMKVMEAFFTNSLPAFVKEHRGLKKANTALSRLDEVREQEARRIAHTLHGETAQLLAAVHLDVECIAREAPPPLRERLRAVRVSLDHFEEEVRRLSHELCPTILANLGLRSALNLLAEGVSKRSGIRVNVDIAVSGRLPVRIETALYRIAQEALNNLVKHSHSSHATIQCQKRGRHVSCSVKDNGTGFKVRAALSKKGDQG